MNPSPTGPDIPAIAAEARAVLARISEGAGRAIARSNAEPAAPEPPQAPPKPPVRLPPGRAGVAVLRERMLADLDPEARARAQQHRAKLSRWLGQDPEAVRDAG